MASRVTRREFLIIGGAFAGATIVGCGGSSSSSSAQGGTSTTRTAYRLSLRGRRGSKAARLHNANLRFASAKAADTHRAHRGDRSRVVTIVVSKAEFNRLFTSRHSAIADLRKLGGPVRVRR